MDLATNDCDGTNHVSSLNFVLSDTLDNVEMNDGENNMVVPLVLSADLDILKNINGMQVVFIDSSQVGSVSQYDTSIITSTLVDENNQDAPLIKGNPTEIAPDLGSSMKSWSCNECGSTFKKSSELKKHVSLHKKKKSYPCLNCSESFNVEKNLKLHMALHGNTSTQCPECGKRFARFASFKAHILFHIEDDILTCPHCDNEFETSRALSRHLEENHLFETTSLKKKASNMTLTELNSPLSNQQPTLNESSPSAKTYPCKQCLQQFDTFRALKEHSRIHKKVNAILNCKKKSARSKGAAGTPPRYQCAHCSMSFDKPSMRARHERVHTGERPFKCDQCDRGFSQKNSLICHQKAIHVREKPHACTFCPYASSQKGNLRAHVRRLHLPVRESGNVYRCDDCRAVFRSVSSLTAHMTKFHGDSSLLVDPSLSELLILNKQYSSTSSVPQPAAAAGGHVVQGPPADAVNKDPDILQEALERSGLPVTADSQNTDQEASDTASSNTRLLEKVSYTTVVDRANSAHPMTYNVKYKIVDAVRWLLCPHCIKQFKKPLDLVRHLRIHNSIKPFKCHHCQKIFRLKSTLLAHINSHSGTKNYECPVCKKKLASRASLVLHQKLHSGHRPHTCPHCSKQFRHRSYFNVHVQAHQRSLKASGKLNALPVSGTVEEVSHSSAKGSEPPSGVVFAEPFEVTESGVFQRQPLHAQLFVRSDKTGNSASGASAPPFRPYKCTQCGAGFKKSAHLKQHLRTHTGEKPFTCTICLRNFVSRGVLRAHNRTHQQNESRSFQCTECSRFFSTKGTLNRHMSSHSENRPFLCPYCQKSFKTYSVCKKHVTTHRNEVLHMQQSLTNATVVENGPPLGAAPTEPSISEPVPMDPNWEMPLEYEPSIATGEPAPSGDPEMRSMEKNDAQLNLVALELEVNRPPSIVDREPHQYSLPLGVDFTSDTITDTTAADTPLYDAQALSQPFTFQENDPLPPDPSPEAEEPKKDSKKCTECGREFKRVSHLKSHMRTHTGIRPFACDACGKAFASKQILTAHQKTHVDNEASGKSPTVLHDHMQQTVQQAIQQGSSVYARKEVEDSVSVDDQFLAATTSCEIPDSSGDDVVSNSAGAKTSSTGLRDCLQCGKSFKKPSDLVRHMRIHTGEKPFTCNTCDKSFSLKSTLTAHMRTHQPDNKAFSCEKCNGLFSCRNTLRIHMRIHTGVKPFKCPECHLYFRTTGHRQSHLKSHRKASLAADAQNGTSLTVAAAASAKRKVAPKILKEQVQPQMQTQVAAVDVAEVDSDWLNNGSRIITVINDPNSLVPTADQLPTLVTDQMGTVTNLTVKFLVDETGNVQLTQYDSSQLLDFSELFPNQAEGVQGITLTPAELNLHLLTVPERQTSSPNQQQQHQELSKNLINSDSGLRLLAGNPEASLLVSGSQLSLQHHHETEESVGIMLEAVDPAVVLGSQDTNTERVSVIHTSKIRNNFNANQK